MQNQTVGRCNYYLYKKNLISLFLFQCKWYLVAIEVIGRPKISFHLVIWFSFIIIFISLFASGAQFLLVIFSNIQFYQIMSMLADCSKLKFKSSTQLFDEMHLQDIEPICLDDLCYTLSQLLRFYFKFLQKYFCLITYLLMLFSWVFKF